MSEKSLFDAQNSLPTWLQPINRSALDALDQDQAHVALGALVRTCEHLRHSPPLRGACITPSSFHELAHKARSNGSWTPEQAKKFFLDNFDPYHVHSEHGASGFLTGYYEPVVNAGYERNPSFTFPILARPDAVELRTRPRSMIERNIHEYRTIAWLQDPIEAFMIQVQGSASLCFPDGAIRRLIYDGRNNHPYTSIGRMLIESGEIKPAGMSLEALKSWVRAAGQETHQKGRQLLWCNSSFVFFRLLDEMSDGPIGGAGVPLIPQVSLATDRSIWPYGTPFLLVGDLQSASAEWHRFRQLTVSQDTGSAIVGRARGDFYVGSGDQAGGVASLIRHELDFIALLPKAMSL